jgi:hypothetical protein
MTAGPRAGATRQCTAGPRAKLRPSAPLGPGGRLDERPDGDFVFSAVDWKGKRHGFVWAPPALVEACERREA